MVKASPSSMKEQISFKLVKSEEMPCSDDPKDDSKKFDIKKNARWHHDEVMCMLNLIKEQSFFKNSFTISKMASELSILLTQKGYYRTDRQIQVKLNCLRKDYLTALRSKKIGTGVKDCLYFKELHELYSESSYPNGIDLDSDTNSNDDELILTFPNDPSTWKKAEIQKILDNIVCLNLKSEITLTAFSHNSILILAEATKVSGSARSAEQIRNVLSNLSSMYIEYKMAVDNAHNTEELLFLPTLELLWRGEYSKCIRNKLKLKNENTWSINETINLLTVIQDLNFAEEAYNNPEEVCNKIKQNLIENGLIKSPQGIIQKLESLKKQFKKVDSLSSTSAINEFPYYHVYKKLFRCQLIRDKKMVDQKPIGTPKNTLNCLDLGNKLNISAEDTWTKEEVKLLLRTVKNFVEGATRNISEENLNKVHFILEKAGYHKTVDDIKTKLTLLKSSYFRCNLEDSLESDIFSCPFYNDLHEIYQTSVSGDKYEFIQTILPLVNEDMPKFSDENYPNTKLFDSLENSSDKNLLENKSYENWLPVESIMEDKILASDDITNYSKQISRMLNVQANLPDDFMGEDHDVLFNSTPELDSVSVEPIESEFNLQECTSNKRKLIDNPIDEFKARDDLAEFVKFNGPANKRLKCDIDKIGNSEDKVILKNKIVLRPVDVNPTNINLTNSKYVRLTVSNDANKNNKSDHIMAHIEPLSSSSSVGSGKSTPVDFADLKMVFPLENNKNMNLKHPGGNENDICKTIRESISSLMQHNEQMQRQHQSWLEKQFETQRKSDETHKKQMIDELRELRNVIMQFCKNRHQ